MRGPGGEAGFTLIEALVAMAILAVAATGLIRATQAHIDTIGRVESRVVADWVATNRVAEPGTVSPTVVMAGRTWQVTTATTASADPDLAAIRVTVTAPGDPAPRATLRAFADTAAR